MKCEGVAAFCRFSCDLLCSGSISEENPSVSFILASWDFRIVGENMRKISRWTLDVTMKWNFEGGMKEFEFEKEDLTDCYVCSD